MKQAGCFTREKGGTRGILLPFVPRGIGQLSVFLGEWPSWAVVFIGTFEN